MVTTDTKKLKVALVHDYLREYGGAERVVEALHDIFPTAPVFVAFADPVVSGIHWQKFANWDIRQSWLTRIPLYTKLFSPLRVFAPEYFSRFDLSEYDVVISSTNAYFSKAVTVRSKHGKAVHIVYCHTPARSLYGYTTRTDWKKNPVMRFFGTLLNHYLRMRDGSIARGNVDYFIANSKETQRRIATFYRRDSTVIYPPIVVPSAPPTQKNLGAYYLYVGRIAASKHVDLAIAAATKLGVPLQVVGTGPGLEQLQAAAGPTVAFLGAVSDAQLANVYRDAKALLYPAEDEDFGMVPIEAMGYGIPVIAHKSGGPLETIQEGKNGYFFDSFTVESLTAAMKKLEKTTWNKQTIYAHARSFDVSRFQKEITALVEKCLRESQATEQPAK